MDKRVFGPPPAEDPQPLTAPTPYTPPRPQTRQTKRRLLLAARNALKKRVNNRP